MSDVIMKAAELLRAGDVVAIPTETVYGLAGKIDSETAIRKIFSLKKRPFFDPLIVHVSSIEQAKNLVSTWSPAAQLLAEKFWPGPLTMVLPKNDMVSDLITSGFQTVGLRMPKHPLALKIIQACGQPLAAPSANMFGKTSPTRAAHVHSEFPNEKLFIVDGGPCEVGLESTVLSIEKTEPGSIVKLEILRAGAVKKSDIEQNLNAHSIHFQFGSGADKGQSPGHLKHHYMPRTPLVLLTQGDDFTELKLSQLKQKLDELPAQYEGIELRRPPSLSNRERLMMSADPVQAAREFYHQLRVLDEKAPDLIYFPLTPEMQGEQWTALLERMHKAAVLVI